MYLIGKSVFLLSCTLIAPCVLGAVLPDTNRLESSGVQDTVGIENANIPVNYTDEKNSEEALGKETNFGVQVAKKAKREVSFSYENYRDEDFDDRQDTDKVRYGSHAFILMCGRKCDCNL